MTETIDWTKFREACEEARYRWESYTAEEKRIAGGAYHHYRCELCDHDFKVKAQMPVSGPRSIEDIRDELYTAAGNAGRYGANCAQIEMIAKMASICGERHAILSNGRLTKGSASAIIDSYKAR